MKKETRIRILSVIAGHLGVLGVTYFPMYTQVNPVTVMGFADSMLLMIGGIVGFMCADNC